MAGFEDLNGHDVFAFDLLPPRTEASPTTVPVAHDFSAAGFLSRNSE